jgi:hypothetical protein
MTGFYCSQPSLLRAPLPGRHSKLHNPSLVAFETLDKEQPQMLAVAEKVKRCGRCGRERPLVEFRLREKGGTQRSYDCNRCHGRSMNRRTARRRARDVKAFIATASREREWELVVALCNQAFAHFGGFARFFKALMYEMDRAPPSSHLRLRGFIAILNLHKESERQRSDPSIHLATESDIVAAMEHQLEKLVREHPEAVLLAARQAGWEVKEPTVGRPTVSPET